MAADSLQAELLSIAGIESAEVEGTATTPAGVKVHLEPGADPSVVGLQVQAVLESHGLRSRVHGDRPSSPPPPPGAPASVIDLPTARAEPLAEASDGTLFATADEPDRATPDPTPAAATEATAGPAATRLLSVGIAEGRDGVTVSIVAEDGRSVTRRSRASRDAVDAAIVGAVGDLVDRGAAPLPVAVVDHEIDATAVVTVMIEAGEGRRFAGSALLEGGRAFAVASAALAAIEASR